MRISPARYMNDLYVAASSTYPIYAFTMTYPVTSVVYNGTTCTQVTSFTADNQWMQDEAAGLLYVRLGSLEAPLVATYNLYYTHGYGKSTYHTPTDSTTTMRFWEPRLLRAPTTSQTIANLTQGATLTISLSNIELADADGAFASYLTSADSFRRKDVVVWMSVNGQLQKMFTGQTTGIRRDGSGKVSISVHDNLTKLRSPAYWGDTIDEAFFLRKSSSFASLDPSKNGTPCRLWLSATTKNNMGVAGNSLGPEQIGSADAWEEAVCTDYSSTISNTTNGTWGLCRLTATQKTLNFGTNTSLSYVGYTIVTTCDSGSHNVRYGDTMKLVDGIKTVWAVCSASSATGYTLAYSTVGSAWTSGGPVSHSMPMCYLYDPTTETFLRLRQTTDYTTNVTTTSGGNKYISITLSSGAVTLTESGISRALIDPSRYRIFFRAEAATGTSFAHASIVSSLATKAGMSVNSASITAAAAALTVNTAFSIPKASESGYRDYIEYLQDIIKSTFAYVYVNADGELVYKLFATPSASTTLDKDVALIRSMTYEVDYEDVIYSLTGQNQHYASITALDSLLVNYKASSAKARYLHGVETSTEFEHVLEDISGRLSYIMAVLANRRLTVSLSTSSTNMATAIGDDYTLTFTGLPGGSIAGKIVSLSIAPDSTDVQATDLLGL